MNRPLIAGLSPSHVEVVLQRVDEAEVDEMWSFVGKKKEPRWLWHAIDHRTGKVLAYVFGRRADEVFVKLKMLLEPFGITRYYTDSWGAYGRHLAPEVLTEMPCSERDTLGDYRTLAGGEGLRGHEGGTGAPSTTYSTSVAKGD